MPQIKIVKPSPNQRLFLNNLVGKSFQAQVIGSYFFITPPYFLNGFWMPIECCEVLSEKDDFITINL